MEQNPIGRLFGIGPEVPIVQQYESHPITRDMSGISTLFPLTRAMTPAQDAAARASTCRRSRRTSAESWGETDRAALQRGEAKPDPQDPKGPLTVAAVATKDKARMVVYGTSNLASNQFLNIQGNRDFFLNTVSWLAEEEDQISIRPKDTKQTPGVPDRASGAGGVPPAGRGPARRSCSSAGSSPSFAAARRSSRPDALADDRCPRRHPRSLSAAFYYVYEVRLAPEREKAEARKGRVFTVEPADVTAVELKRGRTRRVKLSARGRRLADPRAGEGARRPGRRSTRR